MFCMFLYVAMLTFVTASQFLTSRHSPYVLLLPLRRHADVRNCFAVPHITAFAVCQKINYATFVCKPTTQHNLFSVAWLIANAFILYLKSLGSERLLAFRFLRSSSWNPPLSEGYPRSKLKTQLHLPELSDVWSEYLL